jgi:hypothetical protein
MGLMMKKETISPEITVKNSFYVLLPKIVDERDGHLCIAEGARTIPFDIKRVYYINHLENNLSIRGKHAHKTLKQVLFCISGSCKLTLDDGDRQQTVDLWRDDVGVFLGDRVWHTMHSFSSGCVLLVFASDHYDEKDYIRNYDEFMKFIRGK